MFCIKCGKDAFHGNFCEKCYVEKRELFKLKELKIRYCDNCEKFYTQRAMVRKDQLQDFIMQNIEAKNTIRKMDIKINCRPDKIHAIITAHGTVRPSKITITDKKEITVHPRKMKCPNCIKLLGSYHEAVIQVRGQKDEKILGKLEKVLKHEDIAGVRQKKEGYDVMIVSKSPAIKAAHMLRDNFSVKESYKLVGQKKGRKLYRNFYAIR